MNINDAKYLFTHLQANYTSTIPIDKQLDQLFIERLKGEGLVSKTSLHGRLSSLIFNKKTFQERNIYICEIFTKALKTLQYDRAFYNRIKPHLQVQILSLLNKNEVFDKTLFAQSSLDLSQSIALQGTQQQSIQQLSAEKTQLSILRELPAQVQPLTIEEFKELFKEAKEFDVRPIEKFEKFLESHTTYANTHVKESVCLIKQGWNTSVSLEKEVAPFALDATLRLDKIRQKADEFSKIVHSLNINKKWMLCGSYGRKIKNLNQLFNLLQLLPQTILNTLPKPLLTLMKHGSSLSNPDALVEQLLQETLGPFKQQFIDNDSPLDIPLPDCLFTNDQKELPQAIAQWLPKIITENLESWLKQGLIGNFMEAVPDGEMRELFLWISENKTLLKDKNQKIEFFKNLEKKITSIFSGVVSEQCNWASQSIGTILQEMQTYIPPSLQEIIGLDLSSSPFWLTFEKQINGRYTVLIHTTGPALNYHPKQDQTNKIQWPLKFENVASEQLDTGFFQALLLHFIEPQYNTSFQSRAQNIYEGVLKYLLVEPTIEQTSWQKPQKVLNPLELAQTLLTKPHLPLNLAQFEMHHEAFIHFCQPFLTGPNRSLQINKEISEVLNESIQILIREGEQLKDSIGKTRLEKLKATEYEIREAYTPPLDSTPSDELSVKLFADSFHLTPQVKEILLNVISADQLRSAKETLVWALGDDIGALIDGFINELSSVTTTPNQMKRSLNLNLLAPVDRPKGWLRTILFSVYFRLTIEAIKLAFLCYQAYQVGATYLVPTLKLSMYAGAQRLVPESVQNQYNEMIEIYDRLMLAVQRKMIELVLKIILGCVFSKEQAQKIEAFTTDSKQSLNEWIKILLGTQTVNYTLPLLPSSDSTSNKTMTLSSSQSVKLDLPHSNHFPHFEKILHPVQTQQISQFEVITELLNGIKKIQELNAKSPVVNEETIVHYIIQQISLLEIPSRNHQGFWDSVPEDEIEFFLSTIFDLSRLLNHYICNYQQLKEKTPVLYAQGMLANYTLLAIMDKLAKRDPKAELANYSINSYPLLIWIKHKGAHVETAEATERLQKVCAYLHPTIDLLNIPSEEEIGKLAKGSLFDYSTFNWNYLYNKASYSIPVDYYLSIDSMTSEFNAEFCYLKKLLSKPGVKDKIYPFKNPSLSDKEFYTFLFQASLLPELDSPIPKSYIFLRLQTLISHQLLTKKVNPNFLWELKNIKLAEKVYSPYEWNGFFEVLESSCQYLENAAENLAGYWEAPIPYYLSNAFSSDLYKKNNASNLTDLYIRNNTQLITKAKTQTEVMLKYENPIYKKPLSEKLFEEQLREMIYSENSDQIIRVLAYVKQNKSKLLDISYLDHFYHLLFDGIKLKKQLETSPQVAESLGELFKEIMDHFILNKKLEDYCTIVSLGIKVKKYCLHYAPQHVHTFPCFKTEIDRLIQNSAPEPDVKILLLMLKALTFDPSTSDTKLKILGAFACCETFFMLTHNKTTKNSSNSYLREISHAFHMHYWQWLPQIELIMQSESGREWLLQNLLKKNNIHLEHQTKNEWQKISTYSYYSYQRNHITINFLTGKISDTQSSICLSSTISLIKNKLDSLKITVGHLISKGSDEFETVDGSLKIRLNPAFEIEKMIDGTPYRFINMDDEGQTQWMEQTSNEIKRLYIYKDEELIKTLVVTSKLEATPNQIQTEQVYNILEIHKGEQKLKWVNPSNFKSNFLPFSRFCSLNEVECWSTLDSKHILKFCFKPYDLEFSVNHTPTSVQATNTVLFPGYFIAPNQHHPLLREISSYLLLQNDQGQFKVISPQNQWISSAAWCFLSQLGSFSQLAHVWMGALNESEKNKYYVYEMDAKGELTSDNPEALVSIILLYIMQRAYDKAEKVCTTLESLCKRQPISEPLLDRLVPLLIPVPIKRIRLIRQRLLAAIEENQLVHIQKEKKESEDSQSPYTVSGRELKDILATISLLFDLQAIQKDQDPREKISDNQEWFLFKTLFRHINKLTDTDSVKKFTNYFDLNTLIEFGLPANLSQRYQFLNAKFGKEQTLVKKSLSLASQLYKTPSSIPSFDQLITSYIKPITSHISYQQNPLSASNLSAKYFTPSDISTNLTSIFQQFNPMTTSKRSLTEEDLIYFKQEMKKDYSQQVLVKDSIITPDSLVRDFLYYYSIASEVESPLREKLKLALFLVKGGFDPMTRKIIFYLEHVLKYPTRFPTLSAFENAIRQPNKSSKNPAYVDLYDPSCKSFPSQFPLFDDLFYKIDKKANSLALYDQGSDLSFKIVHNIAIKYVGPKIFDKLLSYVPAIPALSISPSSLSNAVTVFDWMKTIHKTAFWASKAYNVVYMSQKAQLVKTPAITADIKTYASLSKEDKVFDLLLEDLFKIAFQDIASDQGQEKTLALLKSDSRNSKLEQTNESINDYYNRSDRSPSYVRLYKEEALWTLYHHLICSHTFYKKQLRTERQTLLNIFNSKYAKLDRPITFEELCHYFLKGSLNAFSDSIILSPQDFAKLELTLASHIVRYTRLQQMERIISHFDTLSTLSRQEQPHLFEEKIECLVTELKARRAYSLTDLPPRLLRRFMLFELFDNKMIWEKQASRLQDWLLGGHGDIVIELLMSLGKSSFCIPAADSYEADGTKIIFNVWPTEMFATNTKQISKQSKSIFDQTANALTFKRGIPLQTENLEAILAVLKRALELGETINLTKEDAQSLELIFIEQLYKLEHAKEEELPSLQETSSQLKLILKTLRQLGHAIGDEAHELFNDVQELNYPIGSKSSIEENYYQMIESCIRALIKYPTVAKIIRNKEDLSSIEITKYKEKIAVYLALKMSCHWRFKLQTSSEKVDFINFVTGKATAVPQWIQDSPLYSEIAMIKGLIGTLLPLIFSRTLNVDYGASHLAENKEYARPYGGNQSPLEQSSIRNPYESLVKTLVMFLHQGLNSKQMNMLRSALYQKMLNEMKARSIAAEETTAYKNFKRFCPEFDLRNHVSDWPVTSLNHPEAAFLYVRFFVYKTIDYWTLNLRSNAQNFASLFNSQVYDTGTPYNEGNYPATTKVLWDPGTIGEALHIINKKCPADGIHALDNSKPDAVLNEVLQKFFTSGSDFTAIIDGGAQLRGLNNEHVAHVMSTFAKQYRPDIKAIIFFMRDQNNVDQLMALKIGSSQPIPYEQCVLQPAECLSYFDQRHGFAANIPQKFNGKGLILPGQNHTLYRLLQEIFRMRGVKVFRKLIGIGKEKMTIEELEQSNLTKTQTVHFALTPQVLNRINSKQLPSLEEIITFAIHNEQNVLLEHNYNAYKQKVHNTVRRAILDKILESKNTQQMLNIFKEFKNKNVLISTVDDDPKKLYGLIDQWVSTPDVLNAIRYSMMNIIENSNRFTREEVNQIRKKIEDIPVPSMPEKVFVQTDGKTLYTDLLEDIGKEVNQTLEQEQEVENEQELEQDTQRENNFQTQLNSSLSSFEEWTWNKDLSPSSLEWLVFSSPQQTSVEGFFTLFNPSKKEEKITNVPLFKVQDLLKHSSNSILKNIFHAFDTRLWFSNNFLPQKIKNRKEQVYEIGSPGQRELYEVLVHIDDSSSDLKVVSMGCLSQKDAAIWRKKLEEKNTSSQNVSAQKNYKTILYDTTIRTIVAGDHIDMNRLKKDPDFIRLEIQLKFLNGDKYYAKCQMEQLKKWMQTNDVENIKKAFLTIFDEKGKGNLQGSDINNLFSEFNKVPIFDRF